MPSVYTVFILSATAHVATTVLMLDLATMSGPCNFLLVYDFP